MQSRLVKIFGQYAGRQHQFEIKDPSVARQDDGTYIMYATVFGPAIGVGDNIGRFHAQNLKGPWTPLKPARIHGVEGPEICAPQIICAKHNGNPLWLMYVQTSCFSEDGMIVQATSENGIDFYATAQPPMTRQNLAPPHADKTVSLYDVSVSDINDRGIPSECMVFSAYRKIGSGDIFMSVRKKGEEFWPPAQLILKQEDVSFHNHPESPDFEWGLEGAKIMQVDDHCFMLFGVCFLDQDKASIGKRQRVFIAGANTIDGPYTPLEMPIQPTRYRAGKGENGHPDVIDLGDRFGILYQERAGNTAPWHLRYTEMEKKDLKTLVQKHIPSPL